MIALKVLTVLATFATLGRPDKLVHVSFKGRDESMKFQKLAHERNYDLWSVSRGEASVRIPDSESVLREIQTSFNATVTFDDISPVIDGQIKENKMAEMEAKRFRARAAITSYFVPYDELMAWMESSARQYSHVSVQDIGESYEGRMMKFMRISDGSAVANKPAVFITSGIHAREWLATATTVYMMDQLIKHPTFPRHAKLLKKFDFYFSPVINPDGYVYTFSGANRGFARIWRKNRRPNFGSRCVGTDPNRNWDADFGNKGVSKDPCENIFPGPYAFSEPCTQNVRDFALSAEMRGRIKLFYDVHAFSQMYFVPFAFDSYHKPSDDKELRRVAMISNHALRSVNNRHFILGTPGEILYNASGSTMDWFKLSAGVPYSFSFEVYPKTNNRQIGFLAPTSAILPSGREIFEAVLTAAENIKV